MKYSRQNFSADCEHFLKRSSTELSSPSERRGGGGSSVSLLDHQVHAPKSSGDHWDCDLQPDLGYVCHIEQGVYRVYRNKEDLQRRKNIHIDFPTLDIFVRDLQLLCAMIADGPLKTFCYKRLVYLSSKFQLHGLLNEIR